MNFREIDYFQRQIIAIRKQKNISLDQIANISFIDKGQLSKVESCKIKVNSEQLFRIYKCLNIDLIIDESLILEMESKLDTCQRALVLFNIDEFKGMLLEILAEEKKYMNSQLIVKFIMTKYIGLVFSFAEHECITMEKDIEYDYMKKLSFNEAEKQLYFDYKGMRLKESGQIEASVHALEKAKSCGVFPLTYAMVCFHLGTCYEDDNNFLQAFACYTQAEEHFMKDLMVNRVVYMRMKIAGLHSKTHNFDLADTKYDELLAFAKNLDEFFYKTIIVNKAWNKIRQEKYSEVIQLIQGNKDKINSRYYYNYLAYAYYCNFQREESLNCIEIGLGIEELSELNKIKLKTIHIMIEQVDGTASAYNQVAQTYAKLPKSLKYEDKEFFLKLLIDMALKLHKYKDAYFYKTEL